MTIDQGLENISFFWKFSWTSDILFIELLLLRTSK